MLSLCFISAILISCSNGGAKDACRNGSCITMQLQEPISFGKSTTLTVTVSTKDSLSNVEIHLNASAPDLQFLPQEQWFVDTLPNQPVIVTTTVVFPEREENYLIVAGIAHQSVYVDTSIRVHLTELGGTLNPTQEHLFTPGPVVPVTITIQPPTSFLLPSNTLAFLQKNMSPFEFSDVAIPTEPYVISSDIANPNGFPDQTETVLQNEEKKNHSIFTQMSGEVVVYGAFYYYERDDTQLPAPYVHVLLYDADVSGDDDLLASTITGEDGVWQIGPISNWDEDASGALDLYAVFETLVEGEDLSYRQVTNSDKWVYKWQIPSVVDVPDGSVNLGAYSIGNGNAWEPAMWIFQDLRRAWAYIYTNTSNNPGAVAVRWEQGVNSLSWCENDSCCCPSEFIPCASIGGVFIADGHVMSEDTVVHETAHQYMVNAMGFWFGPPNTWDDFNACVIQGHDFFDVKTELCAWTEGWAYFLALAVYDDPVFTRGSGVSRDLEQPTWGDGLAEGAMVEGRITGALYDLFDTTSDGYDQISFGFNPIWEILSDLPEEDTFAEFWDSWQSSGRNQHLAIQAIYQNTIVFNNAPTLLVPDRNIL